MRGFRGSGRESVFVINFGRHPAAEMCTFAKGYGRAASTLSRELLAREHVADYDVYPAVFLFRHALELYLKGTLYLLGQLGGLEGHSDSVTVPNHHRLPPLTAEWTRKLGELFPGDQELAGFTCAVTRTTSEFARLDRDSFSYRYPTDPKGNPSTPENQSVSLEAMFRVMSQILNSFEAIDLMLRARLREATDSRCALDR
ncbi:MAG: hypothetical protein BWY10_02497 [Chloroflexi bacterium ADurb.Bin180]|nr:MAG: hypothetical protein BWY10_02497 [Chloroflexi bacterium ADurb.Bin180]